MAEWKDVVNGLPPIAFEVAREVRELAAIVAGVKEDGGDDFA